MRKSIILITFLFFTTFLCLAQSDSTSQKMVFGARVGFTNSFLFSPSQYYTNFTIEKGKSFAALGPILGKTMSMDFNYPYLFTTEKISLNGFNFVYQINPNPKGKRFDFYFQYAFSYLHFKDNGKTEENFVLNPKNYPANRYYYSNLVGFGNTIGFGFKFKFSNNFYLFQDIGIGMGYSKLDINYGDQKFNKSDKKYELIGGVNIGLGYKFDKRIKLL